MNKLIAALVAGLIIGASLVHFLYPRIEERVEYKDRIKTETKIVTKVVHIKAPDGTERTETEIVDTGRSDSTSSLTALKVAQKQFLFGLGARTEWDHYKPEYVVHVGRRIAGPFLAGLSVGTDRRVEAAVYFEF